MSRVPFGSYPVATHVRRCLFTMCWSLSASSAAPINTATKPSRPCLCLSHCCLLPFTARERVYSWPCFPFILKVNEGFICGSSSPWPPLCFSCVLIMVILVIERFYSCRYLDTKNFSAVSVSFCIFFFIWEFISYVEIADVD